LTRHRIAASRLLAVVARGTFEEVDERTSLADLAKLPTVLLAGAGVLKSSTLDILRGAGVPLNVRIEASTLLEVKRFVEAGLGITYLPEYCLHPEDTRKLRSWLVPEMRSVRREVVLFHLTERARGGTFEELITRLVRDLRNLVGGTRVES
jgi:DNA-binding transcriptional LysR family regulator